MATVIPQCSLNQESPCFSCGECQIDDKNKLRMYIPTLGNTWNRFTKTAFGSEEETNKGEEWLEENDPESNEYQELRNHIYGTRNKYAMLADIANRICIKGNDTIPIDPKFITEDKKRWEISCIS